MNAVHQVRGRVQRGGGTFRSRVIVVHGSRFRRTRPGLNIDLLALALALAQDSNEKCAYSRAVANSHPRPAQVA